MGQAGNNFVIRNNHPNFGAAGSIVAGVPSGTGILVVAADEVTIEGHLVQGNDNVDLLITDHGHATNLTLDPESDPSPDRIAILDNLMLDNGAHPTPELRALLRTRRETRGVRTSFGSGRAARAVFSVPSANGVSGSTTSPAARGPPPRRCARSFSRSRSSRDGSRLRSGASTSISQSAPDATPTTFA